MATWTNGNWPRTRLVKIASGRDKYGVWEHLLPVGTLRRWQALVSNVKKKYGVTLQITPGWNAYRPYWVQVLYRKELGVWAAVPGTSSHGGAYWWQGANRDFAAIDVANWGLIGWNNFSAEARKVGFVVNFVTPQELWHIGDPEPLVIPAGLDPEPFPVPVDKKEDQDMEYKLKSKQSGNWYVIGELTYTKIPYGKSGTANYERARSYNLAEAAKTSTFTVVDKTVIQSLVRDVEARLTGLLKAMGQSAAIAGIRADVAALIAEEEKATGVVEQ